MHVFRFVAVVIDDITEYHFWRNHSTHASLIISYFWFISVSNIFIYFTVERIFSYSLPCSSFIWFDLINLLSFAGFHLSDLSHLMMKCRRPIEACPFQHFFDFGVDFHFVSERKINENKSWQTPIQLIYLCNELWNCLQW